MTINKLLTKYATANEITLELGKDVLLNVLQMSVLEPKICFMIPFFRGSQH